jgi:hypothetical protein
MHIELSFAIVFAGLPTASTVLGSLKGTRFAVDIFTGTKFLHRTSETEGEQATD